MNADESLSLIWGWDFIVRGKCKGIRHMDRYLGDAATVGVGVRRNH